MVSALEKIKEFLVEYNINPMPNITFFKHILEREDWILQCPLITISFGRVEIKLIFCRDYLERDFYFFDFSSKKFYDREIIAIERHDVSMTKFKKNEHAMDGLVKNLLRDFKFINYNTIFSMQLYDIIKVTEEVMDKSANQYTKSIAKRKENAEKERKRSSTKRFEEEWKDYYKHYIFRLNDYDYEKFWKNIDFDKISEKERLRIIDDVEKKEVKIKAKNIREAKVKAKDLLGDGWEDDYILYNTNALKDEPIKTTFIKSGKFLSKKFNLIRVKK